MHCLDVSGPCKGNVTVHCSLTLYSHSHIRIQHITSGSVDLQLIYIHTLVSYLQSTITLP